jgi:hypothetical protein
MAEFSADKVPSLMPVRLSEKNKGAEAGQRAAKGGGGSKQRLGRPKPPGQQQQQQQIGRPAPQPDSDQPQDLRYLQSAMQHFNMKGLGRDVPYFVWATANGDYRQYAQPGHPPFDLFEDS